MVSKPLIDFDSYLENWQQADLPAMVKRVAPAIATSLAAIAGEAARLKDLIADGDLINELASQTDEQNADGDQQRGLDIIADEAFYLALQKTGMVAHLASEEQEDCFEITPRAPLAIAIDPLDGSSNIETNISIGTIFSLMPASEKGVHDSFYQNGDSQLAAGFIVYGPQTILMLALPQAGAQKIQYELLSFHYVQSRKQFIKLERKVTIPPAAKEFAINASNHRHWQPKLRAYIDQCLAGKSGPRERNFNMRWVASLVAEAYRIFARGGIFLYPADGREKYEQGRLRLLYEARPIALMVEAAGGKAIDGKTRILDLTPSAIHQRVPFIFGSAEEVDYVQDYLNNAPNHVGDRLTKAI